MVKDQPWLEDGKALVAINLSSEDPYHDPLNIKLVQETIELAENVDQDDIHLVGAYPVTSINNALKLTDFSPSVYNDAIRDQHLIAMRGIKAEVLY